MKAFVGLIFCGALGLATPVEFAAGQSATAGAAQSSAPQTARAAAPAAQSGTSQTAGVTAPAPPAGQSEAAVPAQSPAPQVAQAATPDPDAFYRLGPDSLPQEGVPRGEIRGPFVVASNAYPGTQHTFWIYVPAQYDPAVPASLMIYNDGHAFLDSDGDIRAQNVMDNLIWRRELPVMIAVFINPGRTPEQPEPTATEWGDSNTNRRVEYNSLDDKYARVIAEELLPAVYKDYNISKDPERHGIGGSSSGAIAAFTVAWQRPDQFHKVLSNIGSFVDLRGGDAYPDIIRKGEKKPIRIFLCDGRNDLRGIRPPDTEYKASLDWFLQNTRMVEALTAKGYDVNYAWGMNKHGQKMAGAMFPEMMRWLWRDHAVSSDPKDMVERSFNAPKKAPEKQ